MCIPHIILHELFLTIYITITSWLKSGILKNTNSIFMIVVIGIITFVSTLLGGFFALKFRDRLHLILGFSAGAVM